LSGDEEELENSYEPDESNGDVDETGGAPVRARCGAPAIEPGAPESNKGLNLRQYDGKFDSHRLHTEERGHGENASKIRMGPAGAKNFCGTDRDGWMSDGHRLIVLRESKFGSIFDILR
jgi:hypothetical protein